MKRLAVLLLTFITAISMQTFTVDAADDLKLIINGETQNYYPAITSVHLGTGDNQLLAPADDIAAALGASYAASGSRITLKKDSSEIVFTVNSKTAMVNGTQTELSVPAQLMDGAVYVPAEFCGENLNFHVLREKAGKRVRIISRTSTTVPGVTDNGTKPGMAELESTVHRPVPTVFEKSNKLDDLIYNKTDYSDAVKPLDPSTIGPKPTGPIIFSQEDFLTEIDVTHNDSSNYDWPRKWCRTEIVDATREIDKSLIKMSVKMGNSFIGEGSNGIKGLPFEKAVQLDVTQKQMNFNSNTIVLDKKLPSPKKTDNYVLTFYIRLIDDGDPDYETGKMGIQFQAPNVSKSLEKVVEFGKEWKKFEFLATGVEDAVSIRVVPAYNIQKIQIGGFEVTNVGEDADTSYFKSVKTDLLPRELAPDAEWRKEALDRIEQVRKGDFRVLVKDKDGNLVPNAEVKFDMFEHEFKFGITMDLEYLEKYASTGHYGNQQANFIKNIGENFNALSVGNHLKWENYVLNKDGARDVIEAAKEKGLKYVRGHALWMPLNTYTAEPQEVYGLLTDTRPKSVRYKELLQYIEEHFAEMNEKFPEIYEWDVTNETHGRTYFTDAFGIDLLKDIYSIAAKTLTNGQSRMLCDNRQFEDAYWDRLDWFREQGIEYDALAMQGHSSIGTADAANNRRPEKYLEVWDRFAYEYKKPFAVTEFSVGAFKSEYSYAGQGDFMRDMMIAAFSHPACTGFNLWWLADYWTDYNEPYYPTNPLNKGNGAGVSPLLTIDFRHKPGFDQYRDLLYNKWWTRDAKTVTDNSGMGSVNGFYGDYDVTVSVGGKEVKKVMAAFHKGYDNVLTITLD